MGMEMPSKSRGSWNLPFRTRNVASCMLFFMSDRTEHNYNVNTSYYLFPNSHIDTCQQCAGGRTPVIPLLSCTERHVLMVLSHVTPLDFAHLHDCPQARQGKNLHVSSVPCMWKRIGATLNIATDL